MINLDLVETQGVRVLGVLEESPCTRQLTFTNQAGKTGWLICKQKLHGDYLTRILEGVHKWYIGQSLKLSLQRVCHVLLRNGENLKI